MPKISRRTNPLRLDPTRTTTLRKRFIRDFNRRFNLIKREINTLLITENALGLKPRNNILNHLPGEHDQKTHGRRKGVNQTGTPEFKKWFGDSKVVDEHGEPLVVYHGSPYTEKLTEFDPKTTGEGNDQLGSGFYFTTNPSTATLYAHKEEPDQQNSAGIVPVFLSIQNPIKVSGSNLSDSNAVVNSNQAFQLLKKAPNIYNMDETKGEISPVADWLDHVWEVGKVTDADIKEVSKNYTGLNLLSLENDFYGEDSSTFRESVKEVLGFDGVVQTFDDETHWVAWFPTQIKSATGNRGTFDPNDPDIRNHLPGEHDQSKHGNRKQKSSSNVWDGSNVLGHDKWNTLKADPEYVYHATNVENLRDIQTTKLLPHEPSFGTDQEVWPDGATENRTYFTPFPSTAFYFAPEFGQPALVRVRRDSIKLRPEGTGDLFIKEEVSPQLLEVVTSDSSWIAVSGPTTNQLTANTRWALLSDPAKATVFTTWLRNLLGSALLEAIVSSGESEEETWLSAYIRESYQKGLGRAFDEVRFPALAKSLDFFEGTRAQFLQQSFGQPVSVNRLKLLADRALEDLKGITETMSTQIRRELVDGMIQGLSPRQVARNINNRVDKIGRTRARTLARTETIRAHAEGALDGMEQLGVEEVGVAVEWETSTGTSKPQLTEKGFPSPCPLCAPLDGAVFTIKEARGLIPRHPNCKCSPIPANVGEDTAGQKTYKGKNQKGNNQITIC